MGSVPSSPNRERTNDPWWPIENQNLSLGELSVTQDIRTMDAAAEEQGHDDIDASSSSSSSVAATLIDDQIDQNCEIVENLCESENIANTISETDEKIDCETKKSLCDSEEQRKLFEKCDSVNVKSNDENEKHEQSLDEFKEELRLKREKRQNAISDLRNEITSLKRRLDEQKDINKKILNDKNLSTTDLNVLLVQLNDDEEKSRSPDTILNVSEPQTNGENVIVVKQNNDIAPKAELAECQFALQLANAEILSLTTELSVTQKQVASLKEVIVVSKQMVEIRENQLTQLRGKLKEIEDSLAERELKIMSDNLRHEYDRQLINIRNLRALYEERARVSAAERENLIRQLETKRTELETESEKSKSLEERVTLLETDLQTTSTELCKTKEQLMESTSENKQIREEMSVINQLFSQLLMGFTGGNDIDIDKLTDVLEDHRELLNDITKGESVNSAAALPKLLFDLVTQSENIKEKVEESNSLPSGAADMGPSTAEEGDEEPSLSEEIDQASTKNPSKSFTSAQEICHNLPKVWKVLIELLNHQKAEKVNFKENGESEDCYNSVQTPTGPQMVLSVSKTYIKLKDLILEKKFLQKETNKLKNLNNHLEQRLGQQESRLGAVSVELNKTWTLVGRMQRQHRQLHTHEQVLRYQLQQKRRMLNELKDELEYCRRKWALAREKNNESQSQWNMLRIEFSNRKLQDQNNSAESGYSDDPLSDEEHSDNDSAEKKELVSAKAQLLKPPMSKNLLRGHSVSPTRIIRGVYVKRNSSAPPVAKFLNEICHTTSEIAPTVDVNLHRVATKQDVNVNLEYALSSSVVVPEKIERVKIKKEIPKISTTVSTIIPSTSAGIKKPDSNSATRPRLSRELRRKSVAKEVERRKGEESLEEMFMRLSGQSADTTTEDEGSSVHEADIDTEDEDTSVSTVRRSSANECVTLTDKLLSEDDERRTRRAARFKRLEEQCSQLIAQVIKTSSRGDQLNQQIDEVHKRYTPVRATSPKVENKTEDKASNDEEQLGACSLQSDSVFLTEKEQEYTSRRSERLKRLEDECKAFLNKVNLSNDRKTEMNSKLGIYGKSAEKLPSSSSNAIDKNDVLLLTPEEIAYTEKRAERLRRLEEQSKELRQRMAESAIKAASIDHQLDVLHDRYGINEEIMGNSKIKVVNAENGEVEYEDKDDLDTTVPNNFEISAQLEIEDLNTITEALSNTDSVLEEDLNTNTETLNNTDSAMELQTSDAISTNEEYENTITADPGPEIDAENIESLTEQTFTDDTISIAEQNLNATSNDEITAEEAQLVEVEESAATNLNVSSLEITTTEETQLADENAEN